MSSNLEIVQAWVRAEHSYEGVDDPLTIVKIDEVSESDERSHGEEPGDFWLRDEVTGQIVRVVDGVVKTVWCNWRDVERADNPKAA